MSCFSFILSASIPVGFSVLGRMSGRWVTTSCPCYSLSLAVEYKNDLRKFSLFGLFGIFCTAIWCKTDNIRKRNQGGTGEMKGYNTSNGYMGYVEGKIHFLFASETGIFSSFMHYRGLYLCYT